MPPDGGEQLVESGELPAEGEGIAPSEEAAAQNDDLEPSEPVSEQSVAVIDAPSLVPPIDMRSRRTRRRTRRRRRRKLCRPPPAPAGAPPGKRRSSRWTAIILLLLAFNVAVIGARNEVVRYLPQTASLFSAIGLSVNLRHLKFEDVKISKDEQSGVPAGRARRHRQHRQQADRGAAPALCRAQRTGQEIYTWTVLPDRSILGPARR